MKSPPSSSFQNGAEAPPPFSTFEVASYPSRGGGEKSKDKVTRWPSIKRCTNVVIIFTFAVSYALFFVKTDI